MSRVIPALLRRWEPIYIDLDLAEVMSDLDPRWEEWTAPEVAEA
jgi:hypothetical protein